MPLKRYDAGPRPSRKKPTGALGGRIPPSGFGFRDPARRPGPGPPAMPGPGPPAIPGITRPGSKKGYGLGLGLGFGIVSRILENGADLDFKYF